MVNKKISELDSVTALGSSDLIPVMQGGVTKKAAFSLFPQSSSSSSTSTSVKHVDITKAPYSADKTGATSSYAAVNAAITAVAATGGVVFFPAGTYLLDMPDMSSSSSGIITIPTGVVLEGVGVNTIIKFTCQVAGGYAYLFKFSGTAPGIRNLKIQRGGSLDGVMINTGTSDQAFLDRVELDGQIATASVGATNYIHGLQLGLGSLTNFVWFGGKTHHMTYPLFQSSPSTGSTNGFLATFIEFYANTATDLEFNGPKATVMRGIIVDNCYAHDQSTLATNGGWFFVGIAKGIDCRISNNKVYNYQGEPVHIEDGSYDIWVTNNTFRACALNSGLSYCQVISSSYRVWILNNEFDATQNGQKASPNYPYMIGLQGGGNPSNITDGGNNFYPPSEVHVRGNHFHCYTANGIYVEANGRTKISQNRFKGTGDWDATGLNYIGTNAGWGIDVVNGDGVQVIDNDFEGIALPFQRRNNSASDPTGSRSGIFALNRISKAKVGMLFMNPERIKIHGNIVSRAEFPYVIGQASGLSKIVSFTDNDAFDCKWPINVKGRHTIVATAAAAIANGVTLAVTGLWVSVPSGVAFTFPNGAVFTTTASAVPGATSMTGNVTVAAITSGSGGTSATGAIPHSSTAADNYVMSANNMDTMAGVYA